MRRILFITWLIVAINLSVTVSNNAQARQLDIKNSNLSLRLSTNHDNQHQVVASQFSLTQDISNVALHFGHAERRHEQFNQLGLSWRKNTLYGFNGYANGIYQGGNSDQSFDPFLFHGGSTQQIQFSGTTLARSLAGGLLHLTHAKVQENHRQQRNAWQLGYDHERWSIALIQSQLDSHKTGRGISLGWSTQHYRFNFQHLQSHTDAAVNRLGINFSKRNIDYGLSLSSQRNPLYTNKNENKLMLTMGFSFDAEPMHATEANGPTPLPTLRKRQRGRFIALMIGAAVVTTAALLSSGSTDIDESSRYTTQHQAARAVLNDVNPKSVRQNREHGGYIYRQADKTYSSTIPKRGTSHSLLLPDINSVIPNDSHATASYHTHAGKDPRYDNEHFSPTDIESSKKFDIDGYLGTPLGKFQYYNVRKNKIYLLGEIAH